MKPKPEILYFDIRGRAERIRLLLEDVGVEYVDKQIAAKDWPEIRVTAPFRRENRGQTTISPGYQVQAAKSG